MDKIGIFGGTFDPIHNGHLFLAENLRHSLGLDYVLFVPSGDASPRRRKRIGATATQRFHMCELAVGGSNAHVSSYETNKKETCYTIETIKALKEIFAGRNLFFLIGSDNIGDMRRWRSWKSILQEINVVAGYRPGTHPGECDDVRFIETPSLDISSTMIRNRVRDGLPIRYLMPDTVCKYIEAQKLYRGSSDV